MTMYFLQGSDVYISRGIVFRDKASGKVIPGPDEYFIGNGEPKPTGAFFDPDALQVQGSAKYDTGEHIMELDELTKAFIESAKANNKAQVTVPTRYIDAIREEYDIVLITSSALLTTFAFE